MSWERVKGLNREKFDMTIHRTMCDVLTEIRALDKAKNYGCLLGLIEEVQSMGNRMEAKIYTINDFESYTKSVKKLEKDVEKLREEKKRLKDELGKKEVPF